MQILGPLSRGNDDQETSFADDVLQVSKGKGIDGLLAHTEPVALHAELSERVKSFRGIGAANAAEQIITAAESIVANVAEGYGRGPGADGCRLLRYARGSALELEGHVTTSTRAGRLTPDEGVAYRERIQRIRALIHGLIRKFGGT